MTNDEIDQIVQARNDARTRGDFVEADRLRRELDGAAYVNGPFRWSVKIEDRRGGTDWLWHMDVWPRS
jgi:cysteinyl-tRNA synthetase